ncbi:epididymal-specific lipocalin-8 isoform X2 [Nycticebus coucang]|uniref:epididymal-specific lipocalin-8 isoform X2 n=1 Tax=Nycticebus coucang TaxID=9470 RepID=UPI00234D17F1|nr:epididymal-specific lipocalin-8 isoform X2 [Nycticebus coucang]
MEAWLLSAILGMFTVIQAQVEAAMVDLDRQKLIGFWREVGVASDQNLVLKSPKRVEGLFLTMNGSNLTVKTAYNNSGSCETEKIVGSEINVSGKFAFPGQREIQVLDTDYEGYAILRLSLLWQGREFHVLKYFTRSLEDDDHLGFWRFREVTADTGLYLAPRHGRCAELLKQELI